MPRLAIATEVKISDTAGNECGSGFTQITEEVACRAGMQLAGEDHDEFMGTEDSANWPRGCYYCEDVCGCNDGTWFNQNAVGSANGGARPYCQKDFLPLQAGWQVHIGDSDQDYWATTAEFPNSYNLGFGGYTCTDMLTEIDLYLTVLKPKWIVVTCGENDVSPPNASTAAQAFADFKMVVDKYIAAGARMLTLSTKPEPGTKRLHTVYQEYDALVLEYAKQLAIKSSNPPPLVIINTWQGLLDVGNRNSLYKSDKLHLSSSGYAYWNSWTKTALADTKTCVQWLSGQCAFPVTTTSPAPGPVSTSSPTPGPVSTTADGSMSMWRERKRDLLKHSSSAGGMGRYRQEWTRNLLKHSSFAGGEMKDYLNREKMLRGDRDDSDGTVS